MRLSGLGTWLGLLLLGGSAAAQGQLRRSFWGVAYTPDGVILPDCGARQSDITRDVNLLAQLTPRVRLYGADCNQTAMVLQGIKEAGNVDLSVYLGIFVDGNNTVFQRQLDAVVSAIRTYGTDHIVGITNEYLLRSYGDGGRPTDPAGVAARDVLLENIQTTKDTLQRLNLGKTIPIGTGDAGSAITRELCAGADFLMANIHPYFGRLPIEQAAGWTWQFFQDFVVNVCAGTNATLYLAEAGWPTATDDATSPSLGAAVPSVQNLQTYLDTFLCQSNQNGTQSFWFELQDVLWKKQQFGGVEGHWGLVNANRRLKSGITVPNCLVTSPTGGSPPSPSSVSPSPASSGARPSGSRAAGGSSTSGSNSATISSSSSLRAALSLVVVFLAGLCLL